MQNLSWLAFNWLFNWILSFKELNSRSIALKSSVSFTHEWWHSDCLPGLEASFGGNDSKAGCINFSFFYQDFLKPTAFVCFNPLFWQLFEIVFWERNGKRSHFGIRQSWGTKSHLFHILLCSLSMEVRIILISGPRSLQTARIRILLRGTLCWANNFTSFCVSFLISKWG